MRGPVIVTGGGTGGHVFPMEAIAEALRARGLAPEEIRFVGSRRGQEGRLLGHGPVPLTLLPGRGLRRSLRPYDLAVSVLAALGLAGALVTAVTLVGRWRPRCVVSVGGYASFATCAAAVMWRVPLVLVDFDAVPGAVHRLFRRAAARRCVAFGFPADDAVVTGTPLRAAIEAIDRSDAARARARAATEPPLGPDRLVVVVMTGSLGSRRVNDAVCDLAARWASRRDLAIVHVTGERDYESVLARRVAGDLDYRVVAFADMAELWAVCDVAVCRAGAVTVAELTRLAIPAVVVPLPGAPGDHQRRNADALAAVGGVRVIEDASCDASTLAEALEALEPGPIRAAMSSALAALGRRDAASAIAEVVEGVSR